MTACRRDSILRLTVIIDSGVETIFAAKCCAIPDANLEIILTNTGETAITVTGRFWLEGKPGRQILDLYPQGARKIPCGEGAAFYGSMDAERWSAWRTLALTDAGGHDHRFDLDSPSD